MRDKGGKFNSGEVCFHLLSLTDSALFSVY